MAKNNSTPSAKEIAKFLDYCPKTGNFTRSTRTNNCVKIGDPAGYINAYGYRQIKVNGNRFYASRLAWLLTYNEWPDGQIDHINHIRDDDRIKNLRVVSSKDNCRNRSRAKNNTSGTTGVHWSKSRQRWIATITTNGKKVCKYFGKSKAKAIKARKNAERQHGYHHNHGAT